METNSHRDASPVKKALALKLCALTVIMFGFGYVLVPLYNILCEVTGINGKTAAEAAVVVEAPDLDRVVQVEFMSTVNANGAWDFEPLTTTMPVHPGKLYTVEYFAKNKMAQTRIGQAVPSVAPGVAAKYFQKTECFCFTEQRFEADEGRNMPVTFVVDRDLPQDVEMITLSYTFFSKT